MRRVYRVYTGSVCMCVCALFVLQCCLQFAVAFVVVVVVVAVQRDMTLK